VRQVHARYLAKKRARCPRESAANR
jgi:hypothetical protein